MLLNYDSYGNVDTILTILEIRKNMNHNVIINSLRFVFNIYYLFSINYWLITNTRSFRTANIVKK